MANYERLLDTYNRSRKVATPLQIERHLQEVSQPPEEAEVADNQLVAKFTDSEIAFITEFTEGLSIPEKKAFYQLQVLLPQDFLIDILDKFFDREHFRIDWVQSFIEAWEQIHEKFTAKLPSIDPNFINEGKIFLKGIFYPVIEKHAVTVYSAVEPRQRKGKKKWGCL